MNLRLLITSWLNTIRHQWHFRILLPETKQQNKKQAQTNKNMYKGYFRFNSSNFVSSSLLKNVIILYRISYLSVDELIKLKCLYSVLSPANRGPMVCTHVPIQTLKVCNIHFTQDCSQNYFPSGSCKLQNLHINLWK